jgi:hypothetical protein
MEERAWPNATTSEELRDGPDKELARFIIESPPTPSNAEIKQFT